MLAPPAVTWFKRSLLPLGQVPRCWSAGSSGPPPGARTFGDLPPKAAEEPGAAPAWRAHDFNAAGQDPDALTARLARLLPAVHGTQGPQHGAGDSDYCFKHLPVRHVTLGEAGSLGHSRSAGAMHYRKLDLQGQEIIATEVAPEAARPAGLRTPSVEEIAANLERLPSELAGYLRFVVLHSQPLPTGPGRRTEAAAKQSTVHFFPTDSERLGRLQSTLIHESTHLLQDHLWKPDTAVGRGRIADWRRAMQLDPHPTTLYAAEHVDEAAMREDCAEMAVMYFALQGTPREPYLRSAYPNRCEAFEKLLAAAHDDLLQRAASGPA